MQINANYAKQNFVISMCSMKFCKTLTQHISWKLRDSSFGESLTFLGSVLELVFLTETDWKQKLFNMKSKINRQKLLRAEFCESGKSFLEDSFSKLSLCSKLFFSFFIFRYDRKCPK